MRDDANIRSPRFFVARAVGTCRRCRAPIPLFALAVPPGHLALELDDDADEEAAVDTWRIAAHGAWLFHVEHLAEPVQQRLRRFTRSYRRDEEHTADACWTNRCEVCGAPQDDQALFCEPDGVFSPLGDLQSAAILIEAVEESFAATAGGYAPDPGFFSTLR